MVNKNKNKIKFLYIFFTVLFAGCSVTKYVPENKHILKKNEINIKERRIEITEPAEKYLKQKPNKKVVGIKIPLRVYSLSGNKETKFNNWLKRVGEAPVIYDDFLKNSSKDNLQQYFINKGYRNVEISDTVVKKNKKATVIYNVELNNPYIINKVTYSITNPKIDSIVLKDTFSSLIKKGMIFDISTFEKERERIETDVKNAGYFNFTKETILFQADTLGLNNKVNIEVQVNPVLKQTEDSSYFEENEKFSVKNVFFFTNFNPKRFIGKEKEKYLKELDTIFYKNIGFIYRQGMIIKPKVLYNTLEVFPDSLYSDKNSQLTKKKIYDLGLFKLINIKYNESEKKENSLICDIYLTPFEPQSYNFMIEGTNSEGDIGLGAKIGYQHKNLFHGAEVFDMNIGGAIEAIDDPGSGINNTLEFNSDISLSVPKFFMPFFSNSKFVRKYYPRTTLSLGYNFQQRPDYSRTIANLSFGYSWMGNKKLSHFLAPVDFDLVRLPPGDRTEKFRKEIENTYLKHSFDNHLILNSRYNLVYNTQVLGSLDDFSYFRMGLETGGNLLSLYNNNTKPDKSDYELFGIQYSQFFRTDIDFRYFLSFNKKTKLASRIFAGVGYPYGNSKALPFEKKYYSGGANSIRAWRVRTLGPGSYKGDALTKYPNSLGDIKLELNLEYRFDIFWVIEGAIFTDIGNIWSITDFDQKSGSVFYFDKFYEQLAIGAGFGTRFDFNFFLLRFDFGVKALDPSLNKNERWVIANERFQIKDINMVFSIGYPF